jgi:hypothetical protein
MYLENNMSSQARGTRGHGWVVVVVAIAALTVGWIGGTIFRRPAPAGRPIQDVIDFLTQPLPIPAGAKQLPNPGIGYRIAGIGTVAWQKDVLLDVTDMDFNDIVAIVYAYRSHFQQQFPLGFGVTGNPPRPWKHRDGRIKMANVSLWTWCWKAVGRGPDFDLIMDVELMDFDRVTPGKSRYDCLPIRHPGDPTKGQRVMWIRLNFMGRNLTGVGKWADR